MLDITPTLSGNGSQLNAADLKENDKIIEITQIDVNLNAADQPVTIHFKGENGMPFKPSLTVRRILSQLWGPDANRWRGRKLQLFCDDSVVFGGKKVGGIRIRAASHIEKKISFEVKISRGKRGVIDIEPLRSSEATASSPQQGSQGHTQTPLLNLEKTEKALIAAIKRGTTLDSFEKLTSNEKYTRFMAEARDKDPAIVDRVTEVLNRKLEQLQNTTQPDPIEPGRWPEEEMPA